jgi:hypothetical protein
MANCYTCQAYANAVINSGQKARKQAGIARKVTFTREEFLLWAESHPRLCRYCGIDDANYYALGHMTANGRRLEAIGLDRRDDGDYSLDNIDWCCYPCNRTKANSLTVEEMELLGPALELIWRLRRNLDAGFDPLEKIERLVAEHRSKKRPRRRATLDWQDPLTRKPAKKPAKAALRKRKMRRS